MASVYIYMLNADDTQIYLSFDPSSKLSDINLSLSNCFEEIKEWMIQNYLKLNDDKTEIMVINNQHSPKPTIPSFNFGTIDILCKDSTKNLGFVFDDNMTLDKQINNVTRLCYINLRNLGRIGSKLSKPLKVQLTFILVYSPY